MNLGFKQLTRFLSTQSVMAIETMTMTLYSFLQPGWLKIPACRRVFYRQIQFTAMEPLALVALLGTTVGFVSLSQLAGVLGNASSDSIVQLMDQVLIGEFSTLFCAMVVLSRSGVAATTELASMKQSGEIRSLVYMGISPQKYLVSPRVLAFGFSMVIMTIVFRWMANIPGLALASMFSGLNFSQYFDPMIRMVSVGDIIGRAAKSFLVGALIAGVSCFQGLNVGEVRAEAPRVVKLTVKWGISLILILDLSYWFLRF